MADVRKVVTVLFCDLAGYTNTGDQLDPEALRAIQSRYFEDARAALERHGGTVEKFIGDAVMAVFGIPTLHEDDALRALRAAVDLRGAVVSLGFQARIGVNTGEVVAGAGDALVTGDAVNVAARLEQAAAPGEILLGAETHALAAVAVDVEPVEPVEAKGKPEPLAAYRLISVKEGAEAIARQLDAPLVGRGEELEAARAAFAEAIADRRARLLTVLGPPGIGKSRLAHEVGTTLADEAEVLFGRCLPYGEGITYWPFVEVFRKAGAEDTVTEALSAASPEDVFWVVRKAIEERARSRPVVLVIEDIHWAEPTLLDLVEHLAEWTRDAPLLVLCLSRPELLEERPGWAGVHVRLAPLTSRETDELIAELLAEHDMSDDARSRISATAEGNPLYVEQLVAMLAEGGDAKSIPPTIQALLSARIDGLPPDQLSALEHAAVIGLEFEWGALAELDPDRRRPAGAELSALVRKELIRPHEAIADTFLFRHILLRDAAYERISKERRAALHERLADWLDGRANELDEIVGYHLEQACEGLSVLGVDPERRDALAERAGERLEAAGRRAQARGDNNAAASLLERAARVLPDDSPLRMRALARLGRALADRGSWDDARVVLERAMEAARSSGERGAAAEAAVALAYVRLHTELTVRHADVLPDLESAIEVFEELGDKSGLARGLTLLGCLRYWSGASAPAVVDLERAADLARAAGDRAQEVESLRSMLTASVTGPATTESMRELVDAVRLRVVRSSRAAECGLLTTEAEIDAMSGHFDEGRAHLAKATALADELGLEVLLSSSSRRAAGIVELAASDYEAAVKPLADGCAALERMGDWGHFTSLVPYLVDALYPLGRADEAAHWVDLASRYELMDDLDAQIGVRRARAKLEAHRGDLEQGLAFAQEAVTLAENTDFVDLEARSREDLAELLLRAGRPDEASAEFGRAVALYEQKGNVAAVGRLRTEIPAAAQPPATA